MLFVSLALTAFKKQKANCQELVKAWTTQETGRQIGNMNYIPEVRLKGSPLLGTHVYAEQQDTSEPQNRVSLNVQGFGEKNITTITAQGIVVQPFDRQIAPQWRLEAKRRCSEERRLG